MKPLALVVALLLAVSTPVFAGPVSHGAALRDLTPRQGHLLHGVYPGGVTGMEDDITPQLVRAYESAVGRRVAWVMFSHNWFQGRAFPMQTANWIRAQGAAPYIRLMLRSDTELDHREPRYTLAAIARGDFDTDLAAWGRDAARFGTPFIAEFGTEMNGDWFSWNARWNGRRKGPALFQAAYRHIIDVTRANGASNIVWVFHVNDQDYPVRRWNHFESYYPGDDYIDWLGVSIYSAQGPSEDYAADFPGLLASVMARFARMAPNKPAIVAEFGTDVRNRHVRADQWADTALDTILSGRFPNLIGFSWWNETWQNDDNPAHDTDLRVQSSAELAAVFRRRLDTSAVQTRP